MLDGMTVFFLSDFQSSKNRKGLRPVDVATLHPIAKFYCISALTVMGTDKPLSNFTKTAAFSSSPEVSPEVSKVKVKVCELDELSDPLLGETLNQSTVSFILTV